MDKIDGPFIKFDLFDMFTTDVTQFPWNIEILIFLILHHEVK